MPITIKSTEMKYKNPSTGLYQGIDAIAEMTTSEQCALIEAKGEEVLASLPGTYTELASDVSDLQDTINKEILHFPSVSVNAATSSEMFRLTDERITTSTVVLDCIFNHPNRVVSSIGWRAYNGYIVFSGTCKQGTSAQVFLGTRNNIGSSDASGTILRPQYMLSGKLTSFQNGWSANGECFYQITGEVVRMHLSIRNGTTTNGTVVLGFSSYAPSAAGIFPAFDVVNRAVNGYMNVAKDTGDITVTGIQNASSVVCDLCWIASSLSA